VGCATRVLNLDRALLVHEIRPRLLRPRTRTHAVKIRTVGSGGVRRPSAIPLATKAKVSVGGVETKWEEIGECGRREEVGSSIPSTLRPLQLQHLPPVRAHGHETRVRRRRHV
jgi:hypothetical protein